MTSAISTEIQSLSPSAVIELFVLDASAIGGDVFRFHAGTNALRGKVVWQNKDYLPFPVQVSGFEFSGTGQLPRPKIVVANLTGVMTTLLIELDDLLGAKLIRKRTLAKFLDGANFPSGTNPNADPLAEFADDIFYVDRKVSENRDIVEFELASSFDLQGVKLPRRQIIQNICPWKYRGAECGYTGSGFFDANDIQVGSVSQDVCGKRLSSCKLRFGQNAELPFGGFPAAGLIR